MVYDDRGEFQSRVLEFLADDLARGWRVCYAVNRDTTALWDAALQPAAGEIVIDASGLDSIDHRSMLALANYARSLDTTVVLRTDLPGPARIMEILDLPGMRVEPSA